ncbi:MAG: hypothetical protein ACP5NW_00795 [Candidatus Woesearchaeota archaeon]
MVGGFWRSKKESAVVSDNPEFLIFVNHTNETQRAMFHGITPISAMLDKCSLETSNFSMGCVLEVKPYDLIDQPGEGKTLNIDIGTSILGDFLKSFGYSMDPHSNFETEDISIHRGKDVYAYVDDTYVSWLKNIESAISGGRLPDYSNKPRVLGISLSEYIDDRIYLNSEKSAVKKLFDRLDIVRGTVSNVQFKVLSGSTKFRTSFKYKGSLLNDDLKRFMTQLSGSGRGGYIVMNALTQKNLLAELGVTNRHDAVDKELAVYGRYLEDVDKFIVCGVASFDKYSKDSHNYLKSSN